MFSLSRTSLGTFILLLFISLFLIIKKYTTNKKIVKRIIISLLIIIPTFYFIYNYTGVKKIVYNVIEKFELKKDDQLNGRKEKWEYILNRISFWGNGEKIAKGGAHNTFLSILDQYGIIPFTSWILFILIGLIKSIKIAVDKSNNQALKYLPLFSYLCFAFESFFESMMMKTIMLLCIFCVTLIRNNEKKDNKSVFYYKLHQKQLL